MRRKLLLWVLSFVVVVVVGVSAMFAILAINRAGAFEQAIAGRCAPLVTLAFRGSGEDNLDPSIVENAGKPYAYDGTDLVTNGWEGPTLTRLFRELSHTDYEGLEADGIPIVPIGPAGADEPFGYEAIAAVLEASSISSAATYEGSKLVYSASRGAEAAVHLMEQYLIGSAGCPVLPKFALIGYSQGAMAARHTAELLPEVVAGVVMVGDPYQRPDARGVRDEGAGGVGIIRWKSDDTQRGALDAYYDSVPFTSAICHAGDPICEFAPVSSLAKLAFGAYGDHLSYYDAEHDGESVDDAREIARMAYEQRELARIAFDNGESADPCSLADAVAEIRTPSIAFAGTPVLVSAFSAELAGCAVRYDFDLDGDGDFEIIDSGGTAWVDIDEPGTREVRVRVTPRNEDGEGREGRGTLDAGERDGGDIPLARDDGPPADDIVPDPRPVPTPTSLLSEPQYPSRLPPAPAPTPQAVPDPTRTPTPPRAPGPSRAPSPTSTPTSEPTRPPSPSPSPLPTPEPSTVPTPSPAPPDRPEPRPSATPAPSPAPTAGPTPSVSPTATPSPHPTVTPTSDPRPTVTPNPSPSATPAPRPTLSPLPTPTPVPTPTASPTPGPTPKPTPTARPTITPEPTPTPSPTPGIPTPTPTATPRPTPTITPGPTPTSTVTPTPTTAPEPTPTPTPTSTPTPTAKPRLAPSRTTVPPGAGVTMNGYDFAPSSPVAVTTTFGEPLTVETDETGSFTQWIVVPETAPEGPATITATDGISTVATSITLEFPATNTVRPGEAALITGEGFASRQPVRAVVDGLPGATTETATDNEGRFQLSVRFPSDTEPGRYLLTITIGTGDPMQPDTVIRYATEVLPPDG